MFRYRDCCLNVFGADYHRDVPDVGVCDRLGQHFVRYAIVDHDHTEEYKMLGER